MSLTTTTEVAPVTRSSFELLDFVNAARVEFGETEIRRNDFNNRCKDELEGDHYEINVVKNQNGTESECIQMTRDQCMFVLMRESKGVRRSVTARINADNQKPAFDPATLSRMDILKLAVESEEGRIKAEAERDVAIATKHLIGSKREATAMATASAAKREVARLMDKLGFSVRQATILQVEDAMGRDFDFLPLRRWCNAHEVVAESVPDKRYPKGVKAWPAAAWLACYNVNLNDLFTKQAA